MCPRFAPGSTPAADTVKAVRPLPRRAAAELFVREGYLTCLVPFGQTGFTAVTFVIFFVLRFWHLMVIFFATGFGVATTVGVEEAEADAVAEAEADAVAEAVAEAVALAVAEEVAAGVEADEPTLPITLPYWDRYEVECDPGAVA